MTSRTTSRRRRGWARAISSLPCLVALCLGCHSEAASPGSSSAARGLSFDSAHFVCTRRVEGGQGGNRPLVQYEVWMKGDRAHIVSGSTHVVRRGKETYSWSDGGSGGARLELPAADERGLFAPSVDYVRRSGPCRDKGKEITRGVQDGHPFVSYECLEESDGSTRTYHLATDLQGFPVRARIVYPDRTVVTYTARSAEVPGSFADQKFELPGGVNFEPIKIGQ